MIGLATTIVDTLIGTGGWVGALALAGYLGKLAVDGWVARRKDKREEKTTEVQSEVATVGNMSTVNAIMTKSIESLHAENVRLAERNEFLEKRNDFKDKQLAERDQTIERLKARVDQLVETGQALSQEITTYQKLLAVQEKPVD